ncbi:hypothetical protein BACT_1430 [Bifidobacterium actinocoloniiforme DSM 22766]|uniref:Uncharacterized protein n=1 Tax=Bifidobacterium actinocoloniiforme DSM 22766 TaxID=1437605 RepID=A0A086Z2H3_9BIFI|nr:hypothetical protein [Bifidobacterium actinocoloniiforme]AKV55716.1 hypothetical protein AB656_05455 [Bifidobacterium actinocoloniiforme DSM 22766]KFI40723.1 hypothetical protein BACT_1430 [Bifidobacterium actinocoloniiforme DSM 22766]
MRILNAIYVSAVVIYAGLMIISALALMGSVPVWPLLATLLFACCLLAALRWDWLLPIGLLGLIAAAVVNGFSMYGHINPPHLLARLAVSMVLLGLWAVKRKGNPVS